MKKYAMLFLVSSLSVMILQGCSQKVGEDNTSQTGNAPIVFIELENK